MNIVRIIEDKLRYLQQKGIETSKFELRMLLAFVLKTDIGSLCFYKQPLSDEQITAFNQLVELRAQHWPVDKIIGHKGFYKYDFVVTKDVLSPRADTETVVEAVLALSNRPQKILEFGIGSGCILLSLLAELPTAYGLGIDISDKALKIADKNAQLMNLSHRIELKCASWFDADIAAQTGYGFDLIISNPPYIPSKDIAELDAEVKNFDPLIALDGGDDGLRDYRQIAQLASQLLKEGGYLVFESGINQARDIAQIGCDTGLSLVDIICDLRGIERCIILKK